jgi:hypothetical protein
MRGGEGQVGVALAHHGMCTRERQLVALWVCVVVIGAEVEHQPAGAKKVARQGLKTEINGPRVTGLR